MNIFEALFKAIAWLIKMPIWLLFTAIRVVLYVTAIILLLVTYLLAVLFYPFISIETLRSYFMNIGNNLKSLRTAFFAEVAYNQEKEIESTTTPTEKVEIGNEKKVSVDSTVITKHSGICVACGTAFSDKVKEFIEKNTGQPVFCEFCGKEIKLN